MNKYQIQKRKNKNQKNLFAYFIINNSVQGKLNIRSNIAIRTYKISNKLYRGTYGNVEDTLRLKNAKVSDVYHPVEWEMSIKIPTFVAFYNIQHGAGFHTAFGIEK